MTTMTIDYAVTNPATGEQLKVYPTITDDELEKAIALAHSTHQSWLRSRGSSGCGSPTCSPPRSDPAC
mgnify:CR=1 FL=1